MNKSKLKEIILDQQEYFNKDKYICDREINIEKEIKSKQIIIISGIRRCGKSTLLKIISKKISKKFIYINFDDLRFSDFSIENFSDIEDICYEILETDDFIYLLDEIQNIEYWEKWVNNLFFKEKKVFVTGSNSNLLSSEISSFLTGRTFTIKLFPFSFREFLNLKKYNFDINLLSTNKKREIKKLFDIYFKIGGFPQVLEEEDILLSKNYFEDILNKDVVNRYKIKEKKELNDLVIFLMSNVGKIYSYSNLMNITNIKSLSTIKNFIDYFCDCFVLSRVNLFSYSIKKQILNPSKIYSMDNSFLKVVSFNFSENFGRRLENLVFLHYKRKSIYEIFYHKKKFECDFLLKEKDKIVKAVQVTKSLNYENEKREVMGLVEAVKEYNLKEGLLLTYEDDEKEFIKEGVKIKVRQMWKYLLE